MLGWWLFLDVHAVAIGEFANPSYYQKRLKQQDQRPHRWNLDASDPCEEKQLRFNDDTDWFVGNSCIGQWHLFPHLTRQSYHNPVTLS